MGMRLPKTRGMLRREAATWLARLQSGREPDIRRKFGLWHDSDHRHAAAFDRVRRSYEQAGLLRHSPLAGLDQAGQAMPEPRWMPRPALAAAVAVAILVPAGLLLFRGGLPFGGTDTVMLMTAVGEIKQVDLADGSKVTLDTATKVEVRIGRTRRSANLKYGRARFRIARAATPFVVETAGTTIIASQAVIDVDRGASQDRVQILSGVADVRSHDNGSSPVALAAGDAVTVTPGTALRTAAPPVADWTRGMLQFDGTPLAEAVTLANRYSEQHIILAGDLRALRVTGVFRAGDTEGLAKALAAAFGLTLKQRPDGNLVLSPGSSSRPLE